MKGRVETERVETERVGRRTEAVDILYVRANERVAKGVALLGTYLIRGVVGMLLLGAVLLSL
jgi:hypothetical protein